MDKKKHNSHPAPADEMAQGVVAVAASAGGLRALGILLSGLPEDLQAAVAIVQHLDPHRRSVIA